LKASLVEGEGYRKAALIDPLTGLPNRRSFDETLDVAVFHGGDVPGTMALLFLDVNAFKAINDSFGHEIGDHALRRVADVLRATAMESDIVARLAGDEFVVLMRDSPSPSASWRALPEGSAGVRATADAGRHLAGQAVGGDRCGVARLRRPVAF
jgi:GGDEF domain-containing protein